jgi:hypothetical protein
MLSLTGNRKKASRFFLNKEKFWVLNLLEKTNYDISFPFYQFIMTLLQPCPLHPKSLQLKV